MPRHTLYIRLFRVIGVLRALFRLISAGCLVILFSPTQSAAQFAVCNQTLNVLNIAVGRYAYENFTTSGWWTVGPNRCANVIDRVLDVRYVYVFAQDVFGKEIMRGATPMCIDTKRFDIVGEEDCLLRGYLEARFHEVDTFKSERWTLFIYPPS